MSREKLHPPKVTREKLPTKWAKEAYDTAISGMRIRGGNALVCGAYTLYQKPADELMLAIAKYAAAKRTKNAKHAAFYKMKIARILWLYEDALKESDKE